MLVWPSEVDEEIGFGGIGGTYLSMAFSAGEYAMCGYGHWKWSKRDASAEVRKCTQD